MIVLAAGLAYAGEQPVATENKTDGRTTTIKDVEFLRGPITPAAPLEFFPIPPGTVFERDVVSGEGAYVTAGATEQLIYSNKLGTFGAALGGGKLVADDITTTVPGGCRLVRYEFPVVGKVNPAGVGGAYTVDFAMYRSCPGSVPIASRPLLIIPGTQGQRTFTDQCQNAVDNDGDGVVNDGCPAVGPVETGAQCQNAIDDDGDGKANDGCPAVGDPETDVGSVPRIISFVAAPNIELQTNMWFGVKFSRANAGVVVGTPPLTGFSCDQFDYPGFPCDADAGGFPGQPQASFNLEIFADSTCANSYTGYKNDKPSGSLYNPGTGDFLADDIQLSASGCNMIAYEVAVRGEGAYTFKMQNNCESGLIAGTERFFLLFGSTDVQIARFTFDPPIALPQNLSFQAMISNTEGNVVVSGQQACIGSTADRLDIVVNGVCNQVLPEDLGIGIHGAIDLTITCAGAAPVGACCDMYITDENNDAVCREVPKTNCPFPQPFTPDRPVWVPGAACEPDPFSPHPCGQAACCTPRDGCMNLTRNECYAVPPLDWPRKWDLGRYCGSQGQRCPRPPCFGRTGECTLPRCLHNSGVCNLTTHTCSAGVIGQACSFNSQCNCPDFGCQVNPTCCDSCPPVGCEDPDCCTDVCSFDVYCCEVEWDDACAAGARSGMCGFSGPDVCAPGGRMEGARLITDVPPSAVESDFGRATEDDDDPLFGCYVNNPGAQALQTVWYKFYATYESALLQTCLSNDRANDSLIEVFAVGDPSTPATQCHSLIPVACGDDYAGCSSGGKNAKVCVQRLIPGNLYYVIVGSKIEVADGVAYRLDISAPCSTPPDVPGDFCPDALTIEKKCSGSPPNTICTGTGQGTCPTGQTCIPEGPTPTPAFNLADATMTPPLDLCIQLPSNDKWYKYTATCSGTLSVEACCSIPGTTTNLAIYQDCLCPPMSGDPIGCRSAFEGANCGPGSELKIDVVQGSCYGIRLADDMENRPSGNLKISCLQADCPAGGITFMDPVTHVPTDPPNGVVDAARPHDPNNAALLQGIKTITAYGPRDALPMCFSLCETTNTGNMIDSVVQGPIGTYTITLHNPITAGALTTITYTDTHGVQSVGRFISHPGNVNGDATTSETDVQHLINVLNGMTAPVWGNYSGDINRSGAITPADLLEEVDLLNNDKWNGTPNPIDDGTCP